LCDGRDARQWLDDGMPDHIGRTLPLLHLPLVQFWFFVGSARFGLIFGTALFVLSIVMRIQGR